MENINTIKFFIFIIMLFSIITAILINNLVADYKLKEQKLKLGENNLEDKTDYCFKMIVEYNDNYKYNEIETGLSNYFQVIGRPTIEFKEELVDFNQIVGTVKIKDEGCTIPNEGRECKDKPEMNKVNDFIIRYYGGNSTTRIAIKDVKFDPETMEYKLALSGLKENTLYTFEVYRHN